MYRGKYTKCRMFYRKLNQSFHRMNTNNYKELDHLLAKFMGQQKYINCLEVIYLFIYLFIICFLLTVLQLNIYTYKKKTSSSQGKTTCDAN